ncbi:MAG: glycine zipper family protein [Firmicutes bacterium]|nr:glycine zipper family protein [Bacillota bacterium]
MNTENKEGKKIAVEMRTTRSASSPTLKKDYSKTIRGQIDNVSKRNRIRDKELFGTHQTTIDPYTGSTLHKSKAKAEAKYGAAHTTRHTGQMDHTVPLERIYEATQYNPFLDMDAIKRIANIEQNYEFINTNLNTSKGSKTNLEYVFEHKDSLSSEQARKMIQADLSARMAVGASYMKETLQGMGKEGINGALTAAKYEAILSGFSHLNQVMNGSEGKKEALVGVTKETGLAMAAGGTSSIITKGVEQTALQLAYKANNEVMNRAVTTFCQAGYVSTTIVAVKEVGGTLIKYVNDDIDFDEMILELGEKGSGMVTSVAVGGYGLMVGAVIGACIGTMFMPGLGTDIGGKVGAVAGELIGNMVGYSVGSKLYDYVAFLSTTNDLAHLHFEEVHAEQLRIRAMLDDFQKEIQHQMQLLELKEEVFGQCLHILNNYSDTEYFYQALDTISALVGSTTPAISKDEFYDIMMDENKKFSL